MRKMKQALPFLLGLSVSMTSAHGADKKPKTKDDKLLAEYGAPENLEDAVKKVAARDIELARVNKKPKEQTVRKKKETRSKVTIQMSDLDQLILSKVKEPLLKIIKDYDSEDNKYFQSKLDKIKQKAYEYYTKKLPAYGQGSRVSAEEENKHSFAILWKELINSIYEVEDEIELKPKEPEEDDGLDFSEDEEEVKIEKTPEVRKYNTTLLNILMRRAKKVHVVELAEKVQTLIEYGADKNLHENFDSKKIENQTEYPISIALKELPMESEGKLRGQLRHEVLAVLLNDKVHYEDKYFFSLNSEADMLSEEDIVQEKNELLAAGNIIHSLLEENNKEHVLNYLLKQKGSFNTFKLMLNYLEDHRTFITAPYVKIISGVDDLIYCPILENILKRMHEIRKAAMATDENGVRQDYIKLLMTSSQLKSHMNKNNIDARYGSGFRNRLQHDYSNLFNGIAAMINKNKKVNNIYSELKGEEFQGLAIEWTELAEYATLISVHLNKYALSASYSKNKANIIRLIRYTNMYEAAVGSEEDDIFKELDHINGKDIIFRRRNAFGWTPLMYAMVNKQSDGMQLYLRQAPHEITMLDGVDNNLLHLSFPLPENQFKQEGLEKDEEKNVLLTVGANIGVKGIKEKTMESVMAILKEGRIETEDKITALTKLSASNFTPVSLAAAMGFVDIYDELVKWLKAESAWNRDDHDHLNFSVEELVVRGIKTYLESKENSDNPLTEEEIEALNRELEVRQAELELVQKTALQVLYDSEDERARQILRIIMDPAKKIYNDFKNLDAKDRGRGSSPYAPALEAAMREMLSPKEVKRQETYWEPVKYTETVEKKVAVKQKPEKKSWFSWGKKEPREPKFKVVKEQRVRTRDEKRTRWITTPSPLSGMPLATSILKASYLAQVVKYITELYLDDNQTIPQMTVKAVYQGMTLNQTMSFFKNNFNATVEKRMQKIIEQALKDAGRYRDEDEFEEDEDSNPLSQIGGGAGSTLADVFVNDEDGSESPDDEDNSESFDI